MSPEDKRNLSNAITSLASIDYDLECASRLLDFAHRPGWSDEVDSLLKRGVKLREAIAADLADDTLTKAGKLR